MSLPGDRNSGLWLTIGPCSILNTSCIQYSVASFVPDYQADTMAVIFAPRDLHSGKVAINSYGEFHVCSFCSPVSFVSFMTV